MSLVYAILVFGLLIFVHELGHFIVAKLSGITVLQFTIGFGPAIFKKEYKGTLYALRLLPFGGAVMMKGESDEEELLVGKNNQADGTNDDGGSFLDASKTKRFLVSIAGATMNLVCGLLILIILMAPVKQIYSPVITDFMDGFTHEGESEFMVGDEILKVNGFRVYIYNDLLTALSLGSDKPFDFTVERGGEKIKLENITLEKNSYSAEEPKVAKYGFIFGSEKISPLRRIGYAFENSASFLQSAFKSIGMLISGDVKTSDMMGAVGIAGELTQRAKTSATEMWYFVAFLSINLAFVNMLPIPALDGGKVLFLLIELIARKKINPKYEAYISMGCMVLLLALIAFVTYHDIVRLFAR